MERPTSRGSETGVQISCLSFGPRLPSRGCFGWGIGDYAGRIDDCSEWQSIIDLLKLEDTWPGVFYFSGVSGTSFPIPARTMFREQDARNTKSRTEGGGQEAT